MSRRHPILAAFDVVDRALVAKNFPATTAWWRATLERFYTAGCRQCVIRVGRRGGKSSTLCRVAVVESLYGEHKIAPGDTGVVAIISANRGQANDRIKTIKAILDGLGIGHHPIEGGVELDDRPVAFRVFTASISGVVSFSCIMALCDEVALWADAETGANPAREVLANLRPTLTGQKNAKIFLASSPLSTLDYHARAFEEGDTGFQVVAYAQTWVARPSLTEAETRADEPDERLWLRNYAAIPSASSGNAFSAELVTAAFEPPPYELAPISNALFLTDASSGKKDVWSWGRGMWQERKLQERDAYVWQDVVLPNGNTVQRPKRDPVSDQLLISDEWTAERPPIFTLDLIEGEGGRFAARGLSGDDVVEAIAKRAVRLGISTVVGDQREALMIEAAFAKRRVRYQSIAYTAQNKGPEGVAWISRLLRERRLKLIPHEDLRRELLSFREVILPSGSISYSGKTSDDYACLLITAALADGEGLFKGSPNTKRGGPVRVSSRQCGPV